MKQHFFVSAVKSIPLEIIEQFFFLPELAKYSAS